MAGNEDDGCGVQVDKALRYVCRMIGSVKTRIDESSVYPGERHCKIG